ncbi:hypothetical protein F2Q68_00030190 [Brassica cretica]|uniref:Uncharacterized protein n=1 Tax=Brassica cretica TaxID=69181 RepID=A0A8S9GJN0_BRACR|nr:hypothetical protein F2Q68_00030190 [Brassica cretica]
MGSEAEKLHLPPLLSVNFRNLKALIPILTPTSTLCQKQNEKQTQPARLHAFMGAFLSVQIKIIINQTRSTEKKQNSGQKRENLRAVGS